MTKFYLNKLYKFNMYLCKFIFIYSIKKKKIIHDYLISNEIM